MGLAALVVCGVTLASGVVVHPEGSPTPRREAAVVVRAVGAFAPVTASRPAGERLPSLAAVLAALVLASAVTRRADRPASAPRLADVASTWAPSRAPPAPQNLAF